MNQHIGEQMSFTLAQQGFIDLGKQRLDLLQGYIKEALTEVNIKHVVTPHWYIHSTAGMGKTYQISTLAKQYGRKLIEAHGAQSMPDLIKKIAFAQYNAGVKFGEVASYKDKPVTVWVDDCDTLLEGTETLNVLKVALDGNPPKLAWSKGLSKGIERDIGSDNPIVSLTAQAMASFQEPGSGGVVIPSSNIVWIFSSNLPLRVSREISDAGRRLTPRIQHESAIRDRLNYKSLSFGADVTWGYFAAILLETTDLGDGLILSEAEKFEMLDYLYVNWRRVPQASFRVIKKFAATMKNYPTTYKIYWGDLLV
jgi:hypothetical protein